MLPARVMPLCSIIATKITCDSICAHSHSQIPLSLQFLSSPVVPGARGPSACQCSRVLGYSLGSLKNISPVIDEELMRRKVQGTQPEPRLTRHLLVSPPLALLFAHLSRPFKPLATQAGTTAAATMTPRP